MKYEVGKWYGWTGGECPMHPKSWVDVFIVEEGLLYEDECYAEAFDWNSEKKRIVAFKVVEEYEEPREFWALVSHMKSISSVIHDTKEKAIEKMNPTDELIKLREVKNDEREDERNFNRERS